MTELYLIAHKVRGESAFDIAHQMGCPSCELEESKHFGCHECDSLGYWWIIPTSGHRAYPWWSAPLDGLGQYSDIGFYPEGIDPMPADHPDHYPHRAEPQRDLVALLGLIHKPLAPRTPIKRRF